MRNKINVLEEDNRILSDLTDDDLNECEAHDAKYHNENISYLIELKELEIQDEILIFQQQLYEDQLSSTKTSIEGIDSRMDELIASAKAKKDEIILNKKLKKDIEYQKTYFNCITLSDEFDMCNSVSNPNDNFFLFETFNIFICL